jgi:uncharacterized membrane protein YedE/YeeE
VGVIAPIFAESAPLAVSLAVALVIGVGFGVALERAGLGSARKLVGQFYGRDLSVLKVMFSALLVAMLGVFWLSRVGLLDLDALYLPPTFVMPQAAGAVLFGAGLIVAGLCPGTACVAAATGRIDGLFVLLGIFAGMVAMGLTSSVWADFYASSAHGNWTLAQWLDLPYGTVVAGIVALALPAFAAAEWIERRAQ